MILIRRTGSIQEASEACRHCRQSNSILTAISMERGYSGNLSDIIKFIIGRLTVTASRLLQINLIKQKASELTSWKVKHGRFEDRTCRCYQYPSNPDRLDGFYMPGDPPLYRGAGSNTDLAVLGPFFPMRSFIGDCCETAVIGIKFFIFENNPVESDIFTGF